MKSYLLCPALWFVSCFSVCFSASVFAQTGALQWQDDETYEVLFRDGATGSFALDKTVRRSGAPSLRLTKTNAIGYIEVRATKAAALELERRYTLRGYFHAQDAPLSSLLLFRLGPRHATNFGNPYGLYNYPSNSHIPNSPPGVWEKRAATYTASAQPDADANFATNIAPENAFVHILLIGNPCTVWLDEIALAPADDAGWGELKTPSIPFSPEQAQEVLEARAPSVLQLKNQNGRTRLVLNEKVEAPVMYMSSRNDQSQGDYLAFGQARVPIMIVPVNMEFSDSRAQAWQGAEKYNFARVEADILMALRKNPRADLMLLVGAYAPFDWGEKHPDEVWQNASGERAYSGEGYGGVTHLRGFARDLKDAPPGAQASWYPSYHSQVWRAEAADFVRAMHSILQQPDPDDYVIATGEAHSVREFCELAFSFAGLDYRDYVVTDEKFYRPAEVDSVVGDATKAREKLGWRPKYTFRELVEEMVENDLNLFASNPVKK